MNARLQKSIAILLTFATLLGSTTPIIAYGLGASGGAIAPSVGVALLKCTASQGTIAGAISKIFNGEEDSAGTAASSLAGTVETATESDLATDNTGLTEGTDITSVVNIASSAVAVITGLSGDLSATPSGTTTELGTNSTRDLTDIKEEIGESKRKECMDAIAYAAAKELLGSMTQDIVSWINTGFDGKPLFLASPGEFFKSVADQEVYSFVAELNNPDKYPFGPEAGATLAALYTCNEQGYDIDSCWKQTAVFTLGAEIGENWQDFYSDFSVGGWNGWLAATQNPYNNPIDFQFEASAHLRAQIEAQQAQIRDELMQGDGFLSLKKCVEYNYTNGDSSTTVGYDTYGGATGISSTTTTTTEDTPMEDGGTTTESASATITGYNYDYSFFGTVDNCTRYETTTPGSVISDQLNVYLGSSARQLELADEVDESLSLIFDSLINRLIYDGLSALESDTSVVIDQTGGYGVNYYTNNISSSWYVDPYAPTDLHTLLRCENQDTGEPIPDCTTIIASTEEYLAKLREARDYVNLQVVPALIQLDMRMPEPDIGWAERMYDIVEAESVQIEAMESFDDINKKFIGPAVAIVGVAVNAIPVFGNITSAIILGGAALISIISNILAANDEEKIAQAKAQGKATLNARYQMETRRVQWDIDYNNLPSAASARIQRNKLPGYKETYLSYFQTVKEQELLLNTLKYIESKLGPTASETPTIDSLRSSYAAASSNVASQSDIDFVIENLNIFSQDLDQIGEVSDDIYLESQVVPFAGRTEVVPANLAPYFGSMSVIADIASAIGDCGLPKKDQGGSCPVDEAGSLSSYTDPLNGHTTYYSYDGGRLQNYNPQEDNYHLVDYEAFAFAGAEGVAAGTTMATVHSAAAYLRQYPFGFVASSQYQNPYSIFYPKPSPPMTKSPWYYRQLLDKSAKESGDLCLDSVCDTTAGYTLGVQSDDPTMVYTYMNVTAFNSFDHADSGDKDIWKRIYLNYFQDAYRDPTYPYNR